MLVAFPPLFALTKSQLVKYTTEGTVVVESHVFKEGAYLSDPNHIAVEIVVSDTGCGIAPEKLESIFREFEQVESAMTKTDNSPGLGVCGIASNDIRN